MYLLIRAIALAGRPLTQALVARFDERGGTIGRADDSTLTLPDPERHISRRQAEVLPAGAGYVIRNVGSANPILVNDGPLAPGEEGSLADGDALQIGAYRLEVRTEHAADDDMTQPPRRPFADVAATRVEPVFAFGQPAPSERQTVADAAATRPDPFDLLKPPGAVQAGRLDALLGAPGDGAQALQRFLQDQAPSYAAEPAASRGLDPIAALWPEPLPPPAPPSARADHTPALHAPMPLPRPLPSPAAPSPRPAAPSVPSPTPPAAADTAAPAPPDALWQALCEGLGVALPTPAQGLTPETMRQLGILLRRFTGGTVQLLHLRAKTKIEMRFPATMLRVQDNNPLRYAPNVQAALLQILQPPLPGYLSGPAAAQEAMDDLCAHAIGTMAGMRAALEGVLARFEPPRLERQLARAEVLDAVLPMHRRSRLWELFLQHFEAVRREAQEDFDRLFGEAFVGAYEQQLDRLDAQRRAPREPVPAAPAPRAPAG